MEKLLRFLKDEEGQTGVEYALLVGAIAAAIVVVAIAVGNKSNASFQKVNSAAWPS